MICPLCHSSQTRYKFKTNEFHGHYTKTKKYFNYYQCQKCLSIFPDISKINLTDFYSKNYRQKSNIFEEILTKINFIQQNILIKSIFKSKNISILDVGCGVGNFLKQLPHNFTKTGIDIKIDNPNSKLIQADFLKHKFTQKFDLITFNHSLEHLINPQQAIKKAKTLLNKKGVIIISLPVSDCYSFIINPPKAFHLDPPRHIFIPNTDKFKKILINYFPKVTVKSNQFEFPLDLYWTLKNSHYKYLLPFFPILKLLKPETKIYICQNH